MLSETRSEAGEHGCGSQGLESLNIRRAFCVHRYLNFFFVCICVWFIVWLSLNVYGCLGIPAGLNLSYAFPFP